MIKFLLFFLLCVPAFAADNFEAWSLFLTQKNFGEDNKIGINSFTMPRYSFKNDYFYQNLVGFSGLYKLNEDFTLAIGYLHDIGPQLNLKEKRPFIDLLYAKSLNFGLFLLRVRFEDRLLKTTEIETVRWRLMVRYDFSEETKTLGFQPFLMNEILVNLKDQSWRNQMGFQQNRFFVGARHKAADGLNVDVALLTILNQVPTQRQFVFAPFLAVFMLCS